MKKKIIKINAVILGLLAVSTLINIAFLLYQRQSTAIRYENVQNDKNDETRGANVQSIAPTFINTPDSVSEKYAYKENNQLEWLNINEEYVGWLSIQGTNINYPVVRGGDNKKYLNTDFFNQKSDAGALFMDYRNIAQFNDNHTVIYGHYMKDGSMFHNLHLYKDESFNEAHDVIQLQGLYETRSYTIFSVYIESANDYELNLNALSGNDEVYLVEILSRSMYDFEITPSSNSKILTLVTCSYEIDNGRMIVHAVENP